MQKLSASPSAPHVRLPSPKDVVVALCGEADGSFSVLWSFFLEQHSRMVVAWLEEKPVLQLLRQET